MLVACGACYVNVVWFCGAKTLTGTYWVSPLTRVTFTCIDPGDTGYKYNGAAVGQHGWDNLQYIDYECTYSCVGVDATGTYTHPLPDPAPSNMDYVSGNLTAYGQSCVGGGG